MDIMQKVFDFCISERLFVKAKKVGVGISGGADSVILLLFLYKYKLALGIEDLVAIHVNHNLRSVESDADESFVKALCQSLGISCECISVDVKKKCADLKLGEEEAARLLRYNAFENVAHRYKLNVIALAHHKNDQAETVLMHIFRGAGLNGACGMRSKTDNYVRPLLSVTRSEIEEYLKAEKIKFRVDSTNSDINYSRNYIRKEVISRIEKLYPNCVETISSFASRCRADEDFISNSLSGYLEELSDRIKIKKDASMLGVTQKNRVYMMAFKLAGAYKDIEAKHLIMLDDLFKMKSGSEMHFPMNIVAMKEYGAVVLHQRQIVTANTSVKFAVPQIFQYKDIEIVTEFVNNSEVEFDGNVHFVDYMKIPEDTIWRTREAGDLFAKLGSGTKKLNDYFTDKKISKLDRDDVLLLASGNVILDVAQRDISDLVKIDGTTDKVVKITFRRK